MEEMQRRLDDKDSTKWIPWEEIKAEFGIDESKSAE